MTQLVAFSFYSGFSVPIIGGVFEARRRKGVFFPSIILTPSPCSQACMLVCISVGTRGLAPPCLQQVQARSSIISHPKSPRPIRLPPMPERPVCWSRALCVNTRFLEHLDQQRTQKPIRLCLFLRKDFILLDGVIPQRRLGREDLHRLPRAARVDEVDQVDGSLRECLHVIVVRAVSENLCAQMMMRWG